MEYLEEFCLHSQFCREYSKSIVISSASILFAKSTLLYKALGTPGIIPQVYRLRKADGNKENTIRFRPHQYPSDLIYARIKSKMKNEVKTFTDVEGHHTKMEFSIKDFSGKYDQIRRKLQIWSHLLKKSLMENFTFCTVRELSY